MQFVHMCCMLKLISSEQISSELYPERAMSPKVVMPMKRPAGSLGSGLVTEVKKKPADDKTKKMELDQIRALPTLDQKVEALRLRESNVAECNSVLTPDEQRKLIGRFQTQAAKPTKEGEQLKTAHDAAAGDNMAKRLVVNAWVLDPDVGEKFGKMVQAVSCTQQVIKRDKWITQLQVNALWTQDEQAAHLDSGRLSWRETSTKGVFEFMDTQDMETTRIMSRTCVFSFVFVLVICFFWFVYVFLLCRHKTREQRTTWEIEEGDEDEQLEALLGMPLSAALGSVDKIHGEAIVLVIVFLFLFLILVIACCLCSCVFIPCVLVLFGAFIVFIILCCA